MVMAIQENSEGILETFPETENPKIKRAQTVIGKIINK
jgi:hypothetical protein